MKVVIKFEQNGKELMRHEIEISGEDDLMDGHREAFQEFRSKFPDVPLFEGHLMIGYDKA